MCGRVSDPGGYLYPPRVRRNSTRPTIKRSASGIGVSARCGAVSTRGTAVYVPGSSRLQMYGRMDDRGMAPYPPRRLVFLHRPGLCRPGVSPFESSVCWSCRRVDGCGILKWEVILPGRRWLHLSQPISDEPLGLGFHTARGGINLGDHHSRPRCVLDVWKHFGSRYGT